MIVRFLFLLLILPSLKNDKCVEIDEIQVVEFRNSVPYYLLKKVYVGSEFSRNRDFMRIKDNELKILPGKHDNLKLGYYYLVREIEGDTQISERVFELGDSLVILEFLKGKVNCNSSL